VFASVYNKLRETGALPSSHISSGRVNEQNVDEVESILQSVEHRPTTGKRRISTHIVVPHTTVWRILGQHNLYPFHLQIVQRLEEGDESRRLDLCPWVIANRRLIPLILFTDEASFIRDGVNNTHNSHWFFYLALQPSAGYGLLVSRGFVITQNEAPQSVRLLWMSDQLVAETSTWQHTTHTTNIRALGGIRTHDRSRRAAVDLRLRPRGHWNRHNSHWWSDRNPHAIVEGNFQNRFSLNVWCGVIGNQLTGPAVSPNCLTGCA
jgi:hypothetical protein